MRSFAPLFVLALLAGTLSAQVPKGNVFAGYSFLSADTNTGNNTNLNGWEGTVEGSFLPFLSVVGDVSAHYGRELNTVPFCPITGCVASSDRAKVNSYLFGPRVSVSVHGIRPFAHFLLGAAHTSQPTSQTADTSFATALGGGVDFRIVKFVSWRVQGDLLHTQFFNSGQNNARASTGVVFRF